MLRCSLFLVTLSFLFAAAARPGTAQGIRLLNLKDGAILRYPVPMLQGSLDDLAATSLTVRNQSSQRSTKELQGIAHKGRFKALTELVPGANKLLLQAGARQLTVTLHYKPQTNPYLVQVVYVTDRSGNTKYQSPRPRDPQDHQAKLDTVMKLLQSFTAERMNDLGFGRLTFNLELDRDGRLQVHTAQSERPASFYYKLSDVDFYTSVREWADAQFPSPRAKKLVIAAYTRFDPKSGMVRGNTGRGGGSTALFGSGSMWAWPSTLADVFPAFRDSAPVDGKLVFDDSAGSSTVWGLNATTTSVILHELGHTWDLPHTHDPRDIMSVQSFPRGFDFFNRYFTFVEPPSKRNPRRFEPAEKDIPYLAPISGAAVKNSRWFALERKAWKDGDAPRFQRTGPATIVIEAPHGLAFLGIDVRGEAAAYKSWGSGGAKTLPRRLRLTAAELRKLAGTTDVRLRALDAEGQLTQVEADKLAKP
ncbi:MAG TPA: hypothetical protein VMF69_18205 [Gemmataceae bacterium]|nr:hypothetical protein [Gemmataceae bacterium]